MAKIPQFINIDWYKYQPPFETLNLRALEPPLTNSIRDSYAIIYNGNGYIRDMSIKISQNYV